MALVVFWGVSDNSLTTAAKEVATGSAARIQEAEMDKGYHDNGWLADRRAQGIRTRVPERRQKTRCWTNKPADHETAFRANRRRVRGKKGRQLNRWRGERCERTFAHVCETGGGWRSRLRGQTSVSKAHTLKCVAGNLGLLLRKVWGYSKPRNGKGGVFFYAFLSLLIMIAAVAGWSRYPLLNTCLHIYGRRLAAVVIATVVGFIRHCRKKGHCVTGCYGRRCQKVKIVTEQENSLLITSVADEQVHAVARLSFNTLEFPNGGSASFADCEPSERTLIGS